MSLSIIYDALETAQIQKAKVVQNYLTVKRTTQSQMMCH